MHEKCEGEQIQRNRLIWTTGHRATTSTRSHFAFGVMLS